MLEGKVKLFDTEKWLIHGGRQSVLGSVDHQLAPLSPLCCKYQGHTAIKIPELIISSSLWVPQSISLCSRCLLYLALIDLEIWSQYWVN